MSDFLETKITVFGRSIEIMTPKHRPDAQWEHTLAFFAAYNELRMREADAIQEINSYAADRLRVPVVIGKRDNPAKITVGSDYNHDKKFWHPALPVERWKAPRPNSDKQALTAARRIAGKDYAPKSLGWVKSATSNEDYQLISFEELDSE